MHEFDLDAIDRRARMQRLTRIVGWFALPLAFAVISFALCLNVVGLALPMQSPMLAPLLLLSAAPVPLGALLLHGVRLRRADRALAHTHDVSTNSLTRVWLARAVGVVLPLGLWFVLPDAVILELRLWPLRAAGVASAMLMVFAAALLALAPNKEARVRGQVGSAPWVLAAALVCSLAVPDPPFPSIAALLGGLMVARVGWPALRAHTAIEAGEDVTALWWTRSAPGLTGPVLHTRALRLQEDGAAEEYADAALRAWTPIAAVPRLLVHLSELCGARGERERAWKLSVVALQLNANLPQAYAALAAADLYADVADERTLDLIERAREHSSRGFPRQSGRRDPEYRALHAWGLAATGNLPGAQEASDGAWSELMAAPEPVRRSAEVYLERALKLLRPS